MSAERTFTDAELVACWSAVAQGFQRTHEQLLIDIDTVLGLPPNWFEVLLRLLREPDGRLPMTRIAGEMTITSGGFTRLADRIVDAGLLRREPSLTDRRVTYLELTEHGRAVTEKGMVKYASSLRQRVLSALTVADVERMAALMQLLRNANAVAYY